MTGQVTVSSHVLLCPFVSWGHCKTAITFACKLLENHPTTLLTFVTTGDFTERAKVEVERYFLHENTPSKRLRIVHLGGTGTSRIDLRVPIHENFPSLCNSLFNPGELIRSLDGSVFENPRKPDVFICDVLLIKLSGMVRSIPGITIPVLAWVSPATATMLRLIGPDALGGIGDVTSKAKTMAAENNGEPSEIEVELYRPTKGEIVHMYDGVTLYDYESFPTGQNMDPSFVRMANVYKEAHQMFMGADGMICASNVVLEPEAHDALKRWCNEVEKSCYVVGPLLFAQNQLETIKRSSKETNDLIRFLDKIQAEHGARSLLYLSFGSIYFPTGDGIWYFIRVIVEMNIPLVFSYDATIHGQIPSPLKEDLESSDKILVSPWISQEVVLSHEVTGWYLNHAGLGGIMESIYNGVPMISSPSHAEQAQLTARCSTGLNIAYELIEMRTGDGLRPMYKGVKPTGTREAIMEEARTVLTKAFGKDGEGKRQNIKELQVKFRSLWEEGGASLNDMRRFITDYLPIV